MNFKTLSQKVQLPSLKIEKLGVVAEGIHIPEVVFAFHDVDQFDISYSDTGVFILFAGSHVHCPAEKKYKLYIDKASETTTREIIFQSRNAAAKFVLGDKGSTNEWK